MSYQTPWDVPTADRCAVCAYTAGLNPCNGINCYTGIKKALDNAADACCGVQEGETC